MLNRSAAALAVLLTSLAACATAGAPRDPQPPAGSPATKPASGAPGAATATQTAVQPTAATSPEFAEFLRRVDAYVQLHNRLESTLPKLPTEAEPTAIDTQQRALGQLIQAERKTASRGGVFTPEAQKAIRTVLQRVFGGPDGKQLRASIMDENPVHVKLAVNSRYPDEVPLSTVPPQVLSALPKLPPDVEYRFVGNRLILLDVHAHLVVDYIDGALPS